MGFSYRKRINLGKGLGLNLSSAGVSGSYRTRMGSVGSSGYSIRTGIPGLTYRASWGKSGIGLIILIAIAVTTALYVIVYNFLAFAWYCLRWLYHRLTTKSNSLP